MHPPHVLFTPYEVHQTYKLVMIPHARDFLFKSYNLYLQACVHCFEYIHPHSDLSLSKFSVWRRRVCYLPFEHTDQKRLAIRNSFELVQHVQYFAGHNLSAESRHRWDGGEIMDSSHSHGTRLTTDRLSFHTFLLQRPLWLCHHWFQ